MTNLLYNFLLISPTVDMFNIRDSKNQINLLDFIYSNVVEESIQQKKTYVFEDQFQSTEISFDCKNEQTLLTYKICSFFSGITTLGTVVLIEEENTIVELNTSYFISGHDQAKDKHFFIYDKIKSGCFTNFFNIKKEGHEEKVFPQEQGTENNERFLAVSKDIMFEEYNLSLLNLLKK